MPLQLTNDQRFERLEDTVAALALYVNESNVLFGRVLQRFVEQISAERAATGELADWLPKRDPGARL